MLEHINFTFYVISIHALREEGDRVRLYGTSVFNIISIHALREEGDGVGIDKLGAGVEFLSTPSARRATKGLMQNR